MVLPYGKLPRIVLGWIQTEVIRRKDPVICLGNTLGEAVTNMGLATGGAGFASASKQIRRATSTFYDASYRGPDKLTELRKRAAKPERGKERMDWKRLGEFPGPSSGATAAHGNPPQRSRRQTMGGASRPGPQRPHRFPGRRAWARTSAMCNGLVPTRSCSWCRQLVPEVEPELVPGSPIGSWIVPAEALPKAVLALPPLAAGIILAGLWAADVSTVSALLLGSATLVSTDVVKRFFAPDLSPAKDVLLSRVTVLALSVVTFLLALTVRGILEMLLVGLTLTTAYTLIVVMTMFAPALCRRSTATWTLVTTMLALVAWLLAPASWRIFPHPIYFTWLVSLATFFFVAVADGRRLEAWIPRTLNGFE